MPKIIFSSPFSITGCFVHRSSLQENKFLVHRMSGNINLVQFMLLFATFLREDASVFFVCNIFYLLKKSMFNV